MGTMYAPLSKSDANIGLLFESANYFSKKFVDTVLFQLSLMAEDIGERLHELLTMIIEGL